jgi:hypothetical protein
MAYLANTTGSNMPGRGLINPAFIIKIVPATDDLQQKPSAGRDNPNNDYLDNLKVGAEVSAKVDGEKITGRVDRIIKNQSGEGIYVIIIDDSGKKHKIEGSRIIRLGNPNVDDEKVRLTSSPAIFNESKKFLTYEDFIKV